MGFASIVKKSRGILILILVAVPAHCIPPTQSRSGIEMSIASWREQLHKANLLLQQSDWSSGYKTADWVVRDMRDRLVAGPNTGVLLAAALVFRAIGEAGLGREDDAAWDFCAAQAFVPAYSRTDFRPYGPVGAALNKWRYTAGVPSDSASSAVALDSGQADPAVTPPRKLRGTPPRYPFGKGTSCIEDNIVVQSIVTADGRPEFPYVAPGTDAAFAMAAFDALRSWRFEPARRSGMATRVYFELTVHFKAPACH